MDRIRHFASVADLGDVEIEARIRGDIVNDSSVNRLISSNGWQKIQYYERKRISDTHRKCTYRYRQIHNQETQSMICKSSIVKEEFYDMWCTVHVSTEVSADSLLDTLDDVPQIDVTRYRKTIAQHLVDVTYDESGSQWRVEIEVPLINELDVEAFVEAITTVCSILQDSPIMVSRLDWMTVKTLCNTPFGKFHIPSGSYQKPITMQNSHVMKVLRTADHWFVTPKVDGVRRMLYILPNFANDGIVLSLDLTGCVRHVCNHNIPATTTELTILDCEYHIGLYHVIDVVVHDNHYIGHEAFEFRQKTIRDILESLDEAHVLKKPYLAYDSFRALENRYNTWKTEYNIDGLIFVNKNQGYIQDVFKWKPINTVDLEVAYDSNNALILRTCDRYTVDTANSVVLRSPTEQLAPGIWEFEFTADMQFVAVRSRPDKPQANSNSIVCKNTNQKLPTNLFTGIGCFLMRKYHNKTKRDALQSLHLDKAVILDIGTGQGGDLEKWQTAAKVYCIEPDENAISEITQRKSSLRNYEVSIGICKCMLRDLNISDIQDKISIFAAFFCMNQWEDKDWRKLEEIIKERGTRHCTFVAIALTHPVSGNNRCWTLQLNQPHYTISIHNTRIINVHETVISINKLHDIMMRCGLHNIVRKRLSNRNVMTQEENNLSNMYSLLVYKRKLSAHF